MPHIKICPVAGPYDYGYEFSWQASLEVKKALLLLSTVADFLQVDCQNIDQDDWSTNQDTKGTYTKPGRPCTKNMQFGQKINLGDYLLICF